MPDFLDADCVISSLTKQGILTKKEWLIPKATEVYNVIFEITDSPRTAGFAIYIRNNRHCIGTNALCNQSKRLAFTADSIIKECLAA